VLCDNFNQEIYKKVEPFVFEYTSKLNGSISAEHGIGFHKPKYLHFSKSAEAIDMMRQLKTLMDPNGILNPYKVLPPLK
jgi:D-2-hydroxyglutarate dehydrogenase